MGLMLMVFLCSALSRVVALSGDAPNINYSHNMRILKLPIDTNVGSLIYRLKGSDPDPQDKLVFGTSDPVSMQLLEIRSLSFREADVYLRSSLNETEYNFTIFVTDGKTKTEIESTMIVTKPKKRILTPFFETQYLFSVPENARKNTTVGYVVANERSTSSLPVRFELRGSDKFTIRYVFGPAGASKAEIILLQELDYEKQSLYPLTVLAINAWTDEEFDTRNVASLEVLVTVKDSQDTAPRFNNLPNIVRILDETKVGMPLIRVSAEDGDFTAPRNITYTLEDSKFTPFFHIDEETGEIILKKSVADLKTQLMGGNLLLLPVKARETVAAKDKAPSMSTTVQLAFVVATTKDSLHQDFLNRSVSFILDDSASNVLRRKEEIAKALSQLTGGLVNVFDIHDATDRSGSVVHAWILYPSKSTIDLRNLQKVAADIVGMRESELNDAASGSDRENGKEKNRQMDAKNESIHTASITHHEFQTLLWVLVFFVVLTLVFLLVLFCIWFCCCRTPSQMKVWLDGGTNDKVLNHTQDKTLLVTNSHVHDVSDRVSLMPLRSRRDRDSHPEMPSSATTENGYTNQGFKFSDKAKKIRPPRHTRAKLKPGLSIETGTVYLEDLETRSGKKSSNSSFEDEEDDGERRESKRTEIMYIRSPPESLDDPSQVVNAETEEATNVVSKNKRAPVTKQVSFHMKRLDTPNSQPTRRSTDSGKRKRSPSNETILSNDLVDQIEDNAISISRGKVSETPTSSHSSGSRSIKNMTAVSLPGTVEEHEFEKQSSHGVQRPKLSLSVSDFKKRDEEDNKSDTDSGIVRGGRSSELNIKNKGLMEKKNIFTLAYDGVRTERIKSTESDRDSQN